MKRLFFLSAMFAGLMIAGCQKETLQTELALSELNAVESFTQENCGDCVESYTNTAETYDVANTLKLNVEQNATGLNVLTLEATAGGWTKLTYNVVFHPKVGSPTTLLTYSDPSASGGKSTFRNLLQKKDGVPLTVADFPSNWTSCDYITINFTDISGAGSDASSNTLYSVDFYLAELCPDEPLECISWQKESAYAGDLYPESETGWFYLFDRVEGNATQNIYAGKNILIGTATISGNTLTINLTDGWELNSDKGNELVKVASMDEIPVARPIPGQSNLYKGSSLTVDLTGDASRYLAIHLDVRKCLETNQ